jgi:hypothetical protein
VWYWKVHHECHQPVQDFTYRASPSKPSSSVFTYCAMPRSPIFKTPCSVIKMFSGLMSMCTNPNVCMRFKPVATCLMTYLQSIKGQSREGSNQSNPSNPSNPSNQSNQSNPFTSIHIHHTKKKVSELSRYCKHPRKKRTKRSTRKRLGSLHHYNEYHHHANKTYQTVLSGNAGVASSNCSNRFFKFPPLHNSVWV